MLRKLVQSSTQPLAQLHALWTLEGMGALENADVLVALASPSAGLRTLRARLGKNRDRGWVRGLRGRGLLPRELVSSRPGVGMRFSWCGLQYSDCTASPDVNVIV